MEPTIEERCRMLQAAIALATSVASGEPAGGSASPAPVPPNVRMAPITRPREPAVCGTTLPPELADLGAYIRPALDRAGEAGRAAQWKTLGTIVRPWPRPPA